MQTRVPCDDVYVAFVGKAVYLFSYYEWIVIYITEKLQPGFLAEYCRGHWRGMTAGQVSGRLKIAVEHYAGDKGVEKDELMCCWSAFDTLLLKRNALIHAHPISDVDGAQILSYQGSPSRQISDLKWQAVHLKKFLHELDDAAVQANQLFARLDVSPENDGS